jgi:hypothetical protein
MLPAAFPRKSGRNKKPIEIQPRKISDSEQLASSDTDPDNADDADKANAEINQLGRVVNIHLAPRFRDKSAAAKIIAVATSQPTAMPSVKP